MRLNELIEISRYDNNELADALKVAPCIVEKLRNEKEPLNDDLTFKLAEILNVGIEELVVYTRIKADIHDKGYIR